MPRHVCQALGISWAAQFVKIQNDQVLGGCVAEIETHDSIGRNQKTSMLPKVKSYDRFMDADGTLNLSQAAKAIGFPSGKARGGSLRNDLNWLFLDTKQVLPKASVIKRGFMTAKLWALDDRQKSGVQGRITAKVAVGI